MELQQPKPIEVVLFVDEIKPDATKSPWCYLGLVSVPMSNWDYLYRKLKASRDSTGFQREIKFHKIKRARNERSRCVYSWLPLLIEKDHGVRWSVVGINTSMLQLERFGDFKSEQQVSLQRRFLRATVRHHLKTCYRTQGKQVHVVRFFHDTEGRLEADPYFQWHAINWLQTHEQGISFAEANIRFIHSDHEKETKFKRASHAVQLCDVLIGAIQHAHLDTQLIHHPNWDVTKRKFPERDRLAELFHPLLAPMLDPKKAQNVNSRYGYVGRCNLAFFPSRALSAAEFEDPFTRAQSTFYRAEPLKGLERNRLQLRLGI